MGLPAHALAHSSPLHYERHRPEESALYQTLQTHWSTFLERAEEQGGLPKFVVQEFEAFLDCGILERGCALFVCEGCGATRLLAFSCKRRGFCPSCLGRRMSDVALHLVGHVLPEVPVRQWTCSMPWQLRYLLGFDRKLCAAVLQVIVSELLGSYKRRAKQHLGLSSVALAHPGAVTFVQRFDSALRLNVHAHAVVLDGVYTPSGITPRRVSRSASKRVLPDADSGELCFHTLPEPTEVDVQEVARRIAAGIEKVLRKAGRWLEDEQDGASLTAESLDPQDAALSSCYQAAAAGQELLGERAGQPTLRLIGLPPDRPRKRNVGLVAEVRGVNVHADRAIDGRDRNQLERLLRYTARPPIATERLELLPDGRVRYALKRTWSDGTEAVIMDPLSFIGRLCALIPPPRFHLIRYAGVLAPHSKHRAEVVPGHAPTPVEQQVSEQLPLFAPSDLLRPVAQSRQEPTKPRHPSRHAWALLMRHVIAKDVLACEHCQGRLRVIEVAKTPEAIARVLAHPFGCHTPSGVTKRVEARHAGLGPRPPSRRPRAPPLQLSLPLG